jgi:hypothetical protein
VPPNLIQKGIKNIKKIGLNIIFINMIILNI